MVIALSYDYVGDFGEGLASASKNDQWGAINKQGKTVIPFVYEYVGDFSGSLARAANWGKDGEVHDGIINEQAKVIAPFFVRPHR